MSDPIHHECGLAMVRLKKPLSYYLDKYGTCLWGFQRLYLLMEKQHNRGQDGVGIGCWLPQPLRANANSTRQLANGKRSAGDDVSGWKTAAANADAPLNDLATGGVAGELGMDCTAPIMP